MDSVLPFGPGPANDTHGQQAMAVEWAPGVVRLLALDGERELSEHRFTPAEADRMAAALAVCARKARGGAA